MSERPIKCARNFDDDGRIVLQKGDIVGLIGKGLTGWANRNFVRPRTELFHWLLIGDYLPSEDDYTTLESVNKGVTVGLLSWYQGRAYSVFRLNDADSEHKGRIAYNRASKFGRHRYDWFMAAGLFFTWVRHGFRPLHVSQIPYERDDRFLCTELIFEAYRLVGVILREKGHAPLPAEIKLAAWRGDLVSIDIHNGIAADWRVKRQPVPNPLADVVMAMADASPDSRVFQRDPANHVLWVAFGIAGERIKRADFVGIDPTDGKVYRVNREQLRGEYAERKPYGDSGSHLVGAANAEEALSSAARADNAAKIDERLEQTFADSPKPGRMSPTFVAKAKKSYHPGRDKTHLWTPVIDRPSLRPGTARRACDGATSGPEFLKITEVITNRLVLQRPEKWAAIAGRVSCRSCLARWMTAEGRIFPATYYAKPEGGD